jgi:hypothetical protein
LPPVSSGRWSSFLPRLRAAGAAGEILRTITVDNPRRFLACVPKRDRKRYHA